MTPLKAIIIEDDLVALKYLKRQLEHAAGICISGEFRNSKEALTVLAKEKVDLVFLDIETPELNGIDFMKQIDQDVQIIVVSSKKEYALVSYDFNVTDYLVKPVISQTLNRALERARHNIRNSVSGSKLQDMLSVKSANGLKNIIISDIVYIESVGDYIKIFTDNDVYLVLGTMNDMEEKLRSFNLLRCHRSFIININKIDFLKPTKALVAENDIPISRKYQKIIRASYQSSI